ncbi:MAG: hypothetical protein H7231_02900 [Rhodoferax sp.]|nr:hypothetical protein [Actinomycetota bacterium]
MSATGSIRRLVLSLVVAGGASSAVVIALDGGRPAVPSSWPTWLLTLLLLALAAAAERAYVRVRHGESTEDLTFFEAVVVIAALLLPVALAVAALAGGLALTCLLVRRPLVKSAFNLGSYSLGVAAFVAVSRLVAGTGPAFSLVSVVGVVLGTLAFATVNLLALAAVLAAVEGVSAREVVNDEWQLSAVMATGNAGVGLLAVHLTHSAPALLPFVALPLLAIAYSYRAAARHALERERSRWLVALSGALAGDAGPGVMPRAAEATRGVFAADLVRLVLPAGCVVADAGPARTVVLDGHDEGVVAGLVGADGPVRLPAREGSGPAYAEVAVPLDLDAGVRGALVLGWLHAPSRGRRWARTGADHVDPAMLAAVAAAVAGAHRAEAHLDALVAESSKLQAVVDHSTDGVAVVAADGSVLVWSPTMRQLTGSDPVSSPPPTGDEVVEPVAALLLSLAGPDVDRAALAVELARQLDPRRPRGGVLLDVGAGETRRHLEVTVARITAERGEGRLAVLTAHDVTEARRLERLKGDFIATVSHELRTPMTPIKGYAQLLATRGDQMSPQRRLQALQLIQERAEHMGRLVDDLLLASTVGTEGSARLKVELDDVDLRDVLHRAVAAFPSLADRVSTSSADSEVPVRCDAVRAVQCLTNLLGNAEKYATAGTAIEVELAVTDGWAAVSVADRGPGIPPSEAERVFERFHRLDDALTMQHGGSGLGLYIARELSRSMGGDLTLTSVVGQGSTFTLHLPLRGPVPAGATPVRTTRMEITT